MARRKRRLFLVPEQLSLPLVFAPPPVEEVERMRVGHFLGIRFSNGSWQLTVAPGEHTYIVEEKTPQKWWHESARDEFSLHHWSPCGTKVVGERDEEEVAAREIDQRAVATRWLRSFNEAFQTWRMAAAW